jgi:hypothetical protein
MATLPNQDRAITPQAKPRYCLDLEHPTGQHKARVFHSALGLTIDDTAKLERILRDGIAVHDATLACTFIEGTERWVVQWMLLGRLGPMRMISAWDRPKGQASAGLISCYLKKVKR